MDIATMKCKVLRLLGAAISLQEDETTPISPIRSEVYPSELLIDSINAALDAITVKLWKPSMAIILAPTGIPEEDIPENIAQIGAVATNAPLGPVQATLPTDLIDVESVWSDSLETFLPKIPLHIGRAMSDLEGNAWFLYPSKCITFITDLEDDEKLTVFYSAYWTHVTVEDETLNLSGGLSGEIVELEPTEIADMAIALYAASYCLLNQASQTSSIRVYNTKVDSGTPVQNPAKDMSQYLLSRYQYELDKLPKMDKGNPIGLDA